MKIGEHLELAGDEIVCAKCGHVLGGAGENYKLGTLRIDRPLEDGNALIGDPERYVDADVRLRQYVCPGCGVLFDNEVARVGDPPVFDIRIGG